MPPSTLSEEQGGHVAHCQRTDRSLRFITLHIHYSHLAVTRTQADLCNNSVLFKLVSMVSSNGRIFTKAIQGKQLAQGATAVSYLGIVPALFGVTGPVFNPLYYKTPPYLVISSVRNIDQKPN